MRAEKRGRWLWPVGWVSLSDSQVRWSSASITQKRRQAARERDKLTLENIYGMGHKSNGLEMDQTICIYKEKVNKI